jgi:hypothetical protein
LAGLVFLSFLMGDEILDPFPQVICQFPGFDPSSCYSFHISFIGSSLFADKFLVRELRPLLNKAQKWIL